MVAYIGSTVAPLLNGAIIAGCQALLNNSLALSHRLVVQSGLDDIIVFFSGHQPSLEGAGISP